jgi:PBSX family phage terminase large subunit
MLGPPLGKALISYVDSTARMNLWEGSVSSGKTITVDYRWERFVREYPDPSANFLLVGKTERTLKRNVIDPLIEMFGPAVINTTGMVGRGEIKIWGKRCYLVGANDAKAESKIRGLTLAGAYCDEMTLYPEDFFQMLITRLREPGAKLFGTTNPDNPNHWLKVNYIDKKNPDTKVFKLTIDDNPYLDQAYVKHIKSTFTGLYYRRYILGEWCLAEGAIYDMFDEKVHVVSNAPFPLDSRTKWYVGIDYGTNNPTSFLMIGINNGIAYCVKEYYFDSLKAKRQKTDEEYSQDLKTFIGSQKIYQIIIDPSAASFKLLLKRQGYFVRDADHEVINGIRTVGTLLGTRKYYINHACNNHISEFSGYVWDEKSVERGEDKPKKENDHTLDACRYVLHTVLGSGHGMKVIRSIT